MPRSCLLCLVQFVQKIHTSKVRRGVDKAMIQLTSSPTCLKVVIFEGILSPFGLDQSPEFQGVFGGAVSNAGNA